METYQPIFDAVRSAMGHPDVSGTILSALRDAFDVSWLKAQAQEALTIVSQEWQRPSVLMRPALTLDGSSWCALYGENLQDGVAGFGASPAAACVDFDRAWVASLAKAKGGV